MLKLWFSGSCYFFCFIFSLTVLSQNLEAFKNMRQKEIDSALNFKFDSKKLQWLSLAPSFSYNKTTGFNASVSAASFVRFVQQKHRNRIERERYIFEQKNRLDDEILRIEDKILQLSIDIQLLDQQLGNLSILFDQYQISVKASSNIEISHSQFLDAKYKYSAAWSSHFRSYLSINSKIAAIVNKYNISLTSLSLDLNACFSRLNTMKP